MAASVLPIHAPSTLPNHYVPANFPNNGVFNHAGWMIYTPAFVCAVGIAFRIAYTWVSTHRSFKSLPEHKKQSATLHLVNIFFYSVASVFSLYSVVPLIFPGYFLESAPFVTYDDPNKVTALIVGVSSFYATILYDLCARQGMDVLLFLHHIATILTVFPVAEYGIGLEFFCSAGVVSIIEQPIDLAFLLHAFHHPWTLPVMKFATYYFVFVKALGLTMMAVVLYRQWSLLPTGFLVMYVVLYVAFAAAQVHTAWVMWIMCGKLERKAAAAKKLEAEKVKQVTDVPVIEAKLIPDGQVKRLVIDTSVAVDLVKGSRDSVASSEATAVDEEARWLKVE